MGNVRVSIAREFGVLTKPFGPWATRVLGTVESLEGVAMRLRDARADELAQWRHQAFVFADFFAQLCKEVELPVAKVQKISYQESTVFVSLTQEEVERSPEHLLGTNAAAD